MNTILLLNKTNNEKVVISNQPKKTDCPESAFSPNAAASQFFYFLYVVRVKKGKGTYELLLMSLPPLFVCFNISTLYT